MTFLARGVSPISPMTVAFAAADDELDRRAHLGQLHAHVAQDAGGDAVALAHQTEQQVLGADVVVVEALGLFLGERQDLAGSFRELVELVCHPWLSRRPRCRPRDRPYALVLR